MTAISNGEPPGSRRSIDVADQSLNFRQVDIADLTPTGAQLATAAGIRPASGAIVLQMQADGLLEDIRPDEVVDLLTTTSRFVIVASDRTYRFTVEEQRFDWPCAIISGATIRALARVAPADQLFLERANLPDRRIDPQDLVNLDPDGVESLRIRKEKWVLSVNGVPVESASPTINVGDAIAAAGLDRNKPWHIFLKVAGQPKREVGVGDAVDLTTPGIEKLRVTAKDVNNGEGPATTRRDFALLDCDHRYLDRLGLLWETVIEGERRWLLIYDYAVPEAYTTKTTLLALEVPPAYPGAQIYGFFAYPPLALANGREIPSTQLRASIGGHAFHGWSRRTSAGWNPSTDNVVTQLALVEACLATEAGE